MFGLMFFFLESFPVGCLKFNLNLVRKATIMVHMVNPDYETLSSAMTQPKRQNNMQIWSKNSFNFIFPRCFFDFVLRFSYYIKIQSPTKNSQVWPPWFQCFCSKELARKKKKNIASFMVKSVSCLGSEWRIEIAGVSFGQKWWVNSFLFG